jgi:hypothetical protein
VQKCTSIHQSNRTGLESMNIHHNLKTVPFRIVGVLISVLCSAWVVMPSEERDRWLSVIIINDLLLDATFDSAVDNDNHMQQVLDLNGHPLILYADRFHPNSRVWCRYSTASALQWVEQMPMLRPLSAPIGTKMQFYGTLCQYCHGLHWHGYWIISISSQLNDECGMHVNHQ